MKIFLQLKFQESWFFGRQQNEWNNSGSNYSWKFFSAKNVYLIYRLNILAAYFLIDIFYERSEAKIWCFFLFVFLSFHVYEQVVATMDEGCLAIVWNLWCCNLSTSTFDHHWSLLGMWVWPCHRVENVFGD